MKKTFLFVRIIFICLGVLALSNYPKHNDFTNKIEPVGIVPDSQNGYGSQPDQLAQPDDVEFLKDGSILVSDVNNNRLQLYSENGKLLRSIIAADLNLQGEITPTGISKDSEQFVYVSLEAAGVIVRLKPDLTFDQLIGEHCDIKDTEYYCPSNENCLITPQGLIVSPNGDVFIIDMDDSFRRGADGNIRNFGFRKFKKIFKNGKTTYQFDKKFAATQEITKVMRKSEGMAIDFAKGLLFVAEEKPLKDQFNNLDKKRYIAAFDLKTGKFLNKLYGVILKKESIVDGVFDDSIEGLCIFENYLFAVDEKGGCVRAFNIDTGDYLGFWGHRAYYYCDDHSDCEIEGVNYNEQTIIAGKAIPHLKNNWKKNELASPDGISVTVLKDGSKRLAVVDQWNSRIVIYDLDQIIQTLGN
ncbi:hypothetical protein H8E88_23525 [candidate division KSB1 bacterium]|nr:hypothetical protein [candidate division KSB1 bacterium]MBL7094934.1 hypothetical protein [candidate division KSB1 bacterium]